MMTTQHTKEDLLELIKSCNIHQFNGGDELFDQFIDELVQEAKIGIIKTTKYIPIDTQKTESKESELETLAKSDHQRIINLETQLQRVERDTREIINYHIRDLTRQVMKYINEEPKFVWENLLVFVIVWFVIGLAIKVLT